MPLTKTGSKIRIQYQKEYGKKKGLSYFYATINKKPKQTKKWHLIGRQRDK